MATLPDTHSLALALSGNVLEVTLSRPDRANAIGPEMWREIQASFEWADRCAEVRAIVLAGEGKHFCAGIDLEMLAGGISAGSDDPARRAESFRENLLGLHANFRAIELCRKPVLAAIHGACVGGGVDLVSWTDMRYASEDAYFSIREIDIGMVADVGTLQRLPKLIPEGVARELAFTGRKVDAGEAQRIGLVNAVFANRDGLLEGVRAIAADIAGKSPLAVRGTKEMLNYTRDHSVEDGLKYIAAWNAGMLSEVDLREGMMAQAERREARYQD